MTDFKGTQNKRFIRMNWDLPMISKLSAASNRQLSYFGLPGPEIEDIVDWQKHLANCTGVERLRKESADTEEDLQTQRRLMTNIFRKRIPCFTLMRGEIEDIILSGVDSDNHRLPQSIGNPPTFSAFRYDLVNLDFLGGLGYEDREGAKRIRAIKKLIERQKGHNFLLLLTVNVRDKIRKEIVAYLQDKEQSLADQNLKSILHWYGKCGAGMKSYMLKAAVPLFIRAEAEHHNFDCYCYPPVVYEGTESARMVHFVFELNYKNGIFEARSQQPLADVIKTVFLEVQQAKFVIPQQHEGFSLHEYHHFVKTLPSSLSDLAKILPTQYEIGASA